MSEQRNTSPLPVGRYWIDVADKPSGSNGVDDWNAWTEANRGKVHVQSTEDTPESGGNPHRLFAIFTVSSPVFFPAANFGFPSFAPPSVQSEADTEDVPDAPDGPTLSLPSFADLSSLAPLIFVAIALVMLAKTSKRQAAT
jgi:hypothetical protein